MTGTQAFFLLLRTLGAGVVILGLFAIVGLGAAWLDRGNR